ncbi:MAG: class I SAM-dependent methyltransferase [Desulfobacterales bacterium]|nr:class I SAM-dependent methyltransferase [Desulfobacterales bacterium]
MLKKDIRVILSVPFIYDLFQSLVGAKRIRKKFVKKYVQPKQFDCILDIGCGTAEIINYLPKVEYYGFDTDKFYIESAKKKFGVCANFHCSNIDNECLESMPQFDIVIAMGVLHHLDDKTAINLFKTAEKALKAGGRLITLDPCYSNNQSKIAKYIISNDRGKFVRNRFGYEKLARAIFPLVSINIRNDLLFIPYTHIILECRKT